MREIKFRGKAIDANEWWVGDLLQSSDEKRAWIIVGFDVYRDGQTGECDIVPTDWYEVIPDTVSQYKNLKGKNDVGIYDGDIVHHEAGEYSYVGVVETDCYKSYISGIDPVDAFDFDDVSDTRSGTADLEVIGNKFDNPELLNKGDM